MFRPTPSHSHNIIKIHVFVCTKAKVTSVREAYKNETPKNNNKNTKQLSVIQLNKDGERERRGERVCICNRKTINHFTFCNIEMCWFVFITFTTIGS